MGNFHPEPFQASSEWGDGASQGWSLLVHREISLQLNLPSMFFPSCLPTNCWSQFFLPAMQTILLGPKYPHFILCTDKTGAWCFCSGTSCSLPRIFFFTYTYFWLSPFSHQSALLEKNLKQSSFTNNVSAFLPQSFKTVLFNLGNLKILILKSHLKNCHGWGTLLYGIKLNTKHIWFKFCFFIGILLYFSCHRPCSCFD